MRTTCKQCWKPLSKQLINNHYSWCNKECKKKWVRSHQIKHGRKKALKLHEAILLLHYGPPGPWDDSDARNNGEVI